MPALPGSLPYPRAAISFFQGVATRHEGSSENPGYASLGSVQGSITRPLIEAGHAPKRCVPRGDFHSFRAAQRDVKANRAETTASFPVRRSIAATPSARALILAAS
jgi:hypothetical protein